VGGGPGKKHSWLINQQSKKNKRQRPLSIFKHLNNIFRASLLHFPLSLIFNHRIRARRYNYPFRVNLHFAIHRVFRWYHPRADAVHPLKQSPIRFLYGGLFLGKFKFWKPCLSSRPRTRYALTLAWRGWNPGDSTKRLKIR
jgi:hypothetical protein